MRKGCSATLLLALLLAPSLVCAGCHKPSAQNGASVFHTNCIGCHSLEAGMESHGPSLAHYFKRRPMPSDTQTEQLIRNGRNFMPAFRDKLSSSQIGDLMAYLKTR